MNAEEKTALELIKPVSVLRLKAADKALASGGSQPKEGEVAGVCAVAGSDLAPEA